MADPITERIKFKTEVLKLATLLTVATAGSSVGLLLGEQTLMRLFLGGIGLGGTIGLVTGIWLLYQDITRLIDSLEVSHEHT